MTSAGPVRLPVHPLHPDKEPDPTMNLKVFNTTHAGGNSQITNVNGDFHVVQNVYMMTPDQAHRIYKWLDAPDSSGNFLAAREKHHERTGTWFIEGDEYITWKEIPDSALWVYGTPGSGKTIICSTVIEETLLRCSVNPTHACAYFFFDHRNAQTDQALHHKLIRSVIQQLCDQCDGVPAPLVDIYGNGHQQVSVAALQSVLQRILDGFERTYIIIDALDECTDREKVLAWIEDLMQWKAGKVHFLFSSRPEPDIKEKLRCMTYVARVTLNSRLAAKDIETFLDAMLSKMIRWDAQLIARVRVILITGADGMFRWVALQIAELSKCRTRRAVEDQLQRLPKDLDGMYERALLNHPNQPELKQFLVWLAFSIRPLQLIELADVVTVDFSPSGLPSYDPDRRYFAPSELLATCSSFVTELEGFVILAHMSVKDYLVSDRLKNGPASCFSINTMLAHSMITKTCLAYLFHLRSFASCESISESFPLGPYAAGYWIKHMKLGGGEDEHFPQMMDCIFSPEDNALANWVRLHDADTIEWGSITAGWESDSSAGPLYYACFNGLQGIAQQLLIGGAAVNAQGGVHGNALQAASCNRHDCIIRLLLEHGADVNAQGGTYGSALRAASWWGHDATARLLLEEGADTNLQVLYGNALQAASSQGHDSIVRLLLKKGADVNLQGRNGNALHAASEGGHDAIVRLLLEEGADVHVQGWYGNALEAASSRGHDAIVQMLLEKGADANMRGRYGNALHAASSRGRYAIVRFLLEKGADVNAQGGQYGNALQAASSGGHDAIVRLLLEEGADVNMQGGQNGNALQAASSEGHDSIVRLLLEQGADMNMRGQYGTALHAASLRGRDAIVRFLLEKGADVNAQGGQHGNALQAASYEGHDAIVWLLLEQGADVNVQGGDYGNALQAASLEGHDSIVRWLLEHGADVNVQGRIFGHALQAASHRGHDVIVRLLLENGADVNLQGDRLLLKEGADVNVKGWNGNALQAASSGGHGAIVRLLLEEGADMNVQGGDYGHALEAASEGGHDAIVWMLLEKGADVNMRGQYGTALHAASSRGRDAIVRFLLEKGADVNEQGGEYGNALQAASYGGHDAIVQLLLGQGADVNMQGGKHGTALQAASEESHDAIVRLLLAAGADVNTKGGYFGSALNAAREGSENWGLTSHIYALSVKLLLEHGAIDEGLEENATKHREDEEKEDPDDEVDGGGKAADDDSTGSGSEAEWMSAQEDAEDI